MKTNLFMIIMLMGLSVLSFAQTGKLSSQTAKEAVNKTLNHYIEGTSYSHVDRIKKAFAKDANLYLDDKNGDPFVVTAEKYASWFSKNEAGQFTGRVGNILSVEVFDNVAMASVEILVPKSELRFVDMFILKKQEGEWKIISKTAGKTKSNKTGNRILFAVSNASFYGDSKISNGNSFSEIIEAYEVFDKAGYTIDFVSTEGGAIPLAYVNTSNELSKSYIYNSEFMYAIKNTKKPTEIKAGNYKAIYYVGGGSVMFNTPTDKDMKELAMDIYENHNGIIASICHGTAGIANLKTKDGKYLVDGKTVTGYPDSYENKEKEYFKHYPFLIQETIESRGGTFNFAPRGESHIEVDGRLVTGQNYLSAELVAKKIIQVLEKDGAIVK